MERRNIKGVQGEWGIWERMVPELIHKADSAGRRMLDIHLRRYRIACRSVVGKRVLDVASGTGYGSRILKDAGALSVTGIDISPEAVDFAQINYRRDGIDFLVGNAEEFAFDEPFDVVTSFETMEHLQNPKTFLSLIHRHLKPNGLLMISVPIGETRHIDRYHLHVFERNDVYRLLADAGFRVTAFRFDDWKITGRELDRCRRYYPDSKVAIWKLLLTWRGRRVIGDLLFRGGVRLPMLMIAAHRSETLPCAMVEVSMLDLLD